MKVVSLFAGIGGIDLAFEQAGFQIIWANEIDRFACQTYRANFPNHKLVEGDIRKIKVEDIPSHGILVAGFPCQAFSVAGKQRGLQDKRGNLFLEIIRVLEYHKPNWFLLENVKGLTNKTNKEVFNLILASLVGCGYKVQWKILNAKDFGVPQNRERVFIVGNRLGIKFSFPKPLQIKPLKVTDILEKEVDPKYYLSESSWKRMLNHNQENEIKNDSEISLFTETRKRGEIKLSKDNICPTLRAGMGMGGGTVPYVFQWRRTYIRENKENLIPTLTANMGTGGHNVPYVILPEDKQKEQGTGMKFVGYLNKEIRKNGVSPNTEHLSRVHKQPNRIYSVDGIHPTISSQEIQGRYWIYDNKPRLIGTIGEINRQGYRVYDPNSIGVAVLVGRGGLFSNTEGYLINGRPRKLTLRECSRLMGFPDTFTFPCSNSQTYKQLGNSVCVPLIKELALSVLNV